MQELAIFLKGTKQEIHEIQMIVAKIDEQTGEGNAIIYKNLLIQAVRALDETKNSTK